MTDTEQVIRGAAQILLLAPETVERYKLHRNFREDMCRMILGKATDDQTSRVAKRVRLFAVVDGNQGRGDKDLLEACDRVIV